VEWWKREVVNSMREFGHAAAQKAVQQSQKEE
jgi:hypothetical protein